MIENTHTAGREIHVLPEHLSQPVDYWIPPVFHVSVTDIDPRAFLLQKVCPLYPPSLPWICWCSNCNHCIAHGFVPEQEITEEVLGQWYPYFTKL